MRFKGTLISFGMIALGACAGGDKNPADTTAVKVDTSAATTAATTPAATTAPAGTMAPVTGTMHEVKMIGDAKGFRFEPSTITIKEGDGIKFENVGGGPHNVSFDPASVPADVKAQLNANFGADHDPVNDLASKLTAVTAGDAITISFAGIKPGTYDFFCLPHKMMGMTGKVTVQ
ncbi:MAG: plastocyanin/azurin family copper-binding protein [Gemmatimonadota bacterium]|nr:plastocyanin/azurin family copper-binding protein [Gemmatimonadota bacterium]